MYQCRGQTWCQSAAVTAAIAWTAMYCNVNVIQTALLKLQSLDTAILRKTDEPSATGGTLWEYVQNCIGGEAGCSRDAVNDDHTDFCEFVEPRTRTAHIGTSANWLARGVAAAS